MMERASNSFANSFRYLADELRDLRKIQGMDWNNSKPSDALMEFSALMFRLNNLVEEVDGEGLLPATLTSWLADKRKERAEAGGNVWDLCFHEFEAIVGYYPEDAVVTCEEPGHLNDDGHWYGSKGYFELSPGPIAELLPGVFLPIPGTVYGDDKLIESAGKLYGKSYYKVMGYMAVACDVLGKWIEDRLAQGDGDHGDDERIIHGDGLSIDGRTLRWGGELFPLGPSAAGVVRLLVDAFDTGIPYLHEDYLKENGETDTDMRRLVPDNGLASVVIRQLNRNGKPVKGMWGLIDPKKLSIAQKVHG